MYFLDFGFHRNDEKKNYAKLSKYIFGRAFPDINIGWLRFCVKRLFG
jgi:hypothetical protein